MADNTSTQTSVPATLPGSLVIATRAVTYSGDANAHIAPSGLVSFGGSDDAKTATDVPLPTTIGANGGLKVDIVGDTGTASVLDAQNLAGVSLNTKAMLDGATTITPKFAKIDRATNADGAAVVSLVASKKIRVLRYRLIPAGDVGIKWQSSTSNSTGTGTNTDLDPVESYKAGGGITEAFCPVGIMETAVGEALKLNLNAAVQVSGNLTYVEVEVA